jgi:hypothetical protein
MQEIGNNPQLIYSYFAEKFDSAFNARQCLMIEPGAFAIALLENNQLLAYEVFSLQQWNEQLFSQSRIAALKQSLPAMVIIRTDSALLVPEAFRSISHEFLHLFFPVKEANETAEHKPSALPAAVCFQAEKNILTLIRHHFPGAIITHHSIPVLKWMIDHPKLTQSSLLIELLKGRIFIYAVKHSAPLFYNSFEVNSAEDVAYYTLFVMEQLEMDPVHQTVYFKTAKQFENLLAICQNFIPAFVSIDVLQSVKKPGSDFLFPFLVNAPLCE